MNKVWASEFKNIMNVTVAFRAVVYCKDFRLRVAASNTFRVFVDGEFLAYGPIRTAHGYSNVSEYEVKCAQDKCHIVVEVASYNINTHYTVLEQPFFSCEAIAGDKVVACTDDFKGYLIEDRIREVAKFSLQRPFIESYVMDCDRREFYTGGGHFREVRLQEVVGNKLLKCNIKTPAFRRINVDNIIESGSVERDPDAYVYDAPRFYDSPERKFKGFEKKDLKSDVLSEACRLKYSVGGTGANRYTLYELERNSTGFVCLDVAARSDAEIYILFDEIIYDEIKQDAKLGQFFQGEERPLIFWRGGTLNAVKWKLLAGSYHLMTFEPYTMKYLKVVVFGDADFTAQFITYENGSKILEFHTKDKTLQSIYDAAVATFVQNAVDVLTDCPGRERAGWLCDSYFSARAERLLTGGNEVERNMLNAYLLAPEFAELPKGMLPMCYPADHFNGIYIANWALWLIIQLKDYKRRSGDVELIAAFRTKIYALLDYMTHFENSDGLLERVDNWVFIEWSKANDFTQDVNYPSNMLYYGALVAAADLYGDKALADKAVRVKNAVLAQSYNGEFFVDNAVREAGVLKITGNTSETCQYYAFWFGIADKKSHPELYNTMFNVIKPKRPLDVYPALYKSNAFIGYFLRLDYLARENKYSQVLDECVDYFAYMANRTGTLWEHSAAEASCNHGFASLAAEWIISSSN